ncbi:hypothetical protein ASPCADRAFT_8531 [Aspergillus carbonarius ITEM 5010]|uniref:Uncharacterized protein n=1 Tax=Aspergillus carbonarius (strain ITEM 5010) TaxID=602072 RepID=A0A1R3REI2_ASPC5|nr:hypothetical protein ASPCADRAFT_8531 [Aspergillus carbonarius ITEM 5010]
MSPPRSYNPFHLIPNNRSQKPNPEPEPESESESESHSEPEPTSSSSPNPHHHNPITMRLGPCRYNNATVPDEHRCTCTAGLCSREIRKVDRTVACDECGHAYYVHWNYRNGTVTEAESGKRVVFVSVKGDISRKEKRKEVSRTDKGKEKEKDKDEKQKRKRKRKKKVFMG